MPPASAFNALLLNAGNSSVTSSANEKSFNPQVDVSLPSLEASFVSEDQWDSGDEGTNLKGGRLVEIKAPDTVRKPTRENGNTADHRRDPHEPNRRALTPEEGESSSFIQPRTPSPDLPPQPTPLPRNGNPQQAMTLKEQERLLDESEKENFSLKLKIHFLEERLASLAPEHINKAIHENIQLKVEFMALTKEMKTMKKTVLQLREALEKVVRERDDLQQQLDRAGSRLGNSRGASDLRQRELDDLQRELRDEKERRRREEESREDAEDRIRQLEQELREAEERRGSRSVEESSDEIEDLKQQLEAADRELDKLEAELVTKSKELDEAYVQIDEYEARANPGDAEEIHALRADLQHLEEAYDKDTNQLKDQLAAVDLELAKKDDILDAKQKELEAAWDELDGADGQTRQVQSQWQDEVDEAKAQVEELKNANEEREVEIKDLRNDLQDRQEYAAQLREELAETKQTLKAQTDGVEELTVNIERQIAEKDEDLIAANEEIRSMTDRIYALEESLESHITRTRHLEIELEEADRILEERNHVHNQISDGLKEKIISYKSDLEEFARLYEAARGDLELHQSQIDELTALIQRLEGARKSDQESRRKAINERDESLSTISKLQSEMDALQDNLSIKERELQRVHTGAKSLQQEQKSDKYSLELEIDRVKRDLARCQEDLDRAKKGVERREAELRQKEDSINDMTLTIRELENKLSSERQSRINVTDKLDSTQKSLKSIQMEASSSKERVDDLELRLTEDQRALLQAQRQGDIQRKESNELLLTVFQNVNKVLGADDRATPANFSVFRDTLLQRLRRLNDFQKETEKKIKAAEAGYIEKMTAMKKSLDIKWKQLDHFEASLKKVEVVKQTMRNRLSGKDAELDSLKSQYAQVSSQLAHLKSGKTQDTSSELRSVTARATSAEKRLATMLNQLATYEEKLADARTKNNNQEMKWEARIKEYENRIRIAEERTKTEKQGGKERAAQLESQLAELEKQIEQLRKNRDKADVIARATSAFMPSGNGI